jgi:ligand-binding SRPBCC domain-containing protein
MPVFQHLRAFKHSFVVNSPIDRVWEFYTDIKHLEIITPKEMKLKIINATSEKLTQGSEIWLEAKLMIYRRRWHSIIRSLRPYQYLDEMLTGPFKKWTHLHKFYDINTNNEQKQTEVIDEVDFEIPYSHIGKLFEGYTYNRLQKLFDHRKVATIRTLEGNM